MILLQARTDNHVTDALDVLIVNTTGLSRSNLVLKLILDS
jgi:hypothetical protein